MSDDFQKAVTSQFGQSGGVSVWTDADNVYAEADLPGIDPAKLEVTLDEGRILTIRGERPLPATDKGVWIRHERPAGEFTRTIELPVIVNADAVESKFVHGVLTLTLPKSEAAKPRKIAVN
jgi:HSP20 family protein